MAVTVEGSLERYTVGSSDRMPPWCNQRVGYEVVGQADIRLGTSVVHIVGYPVEMAVVLHHKGAVASGALHRRLLVGMETVRTTADAVGIELMTQAFFLENGMVIALAAGVLHQCLVAVLILYITVQAEVVLEPLHELAAVTIDDMILLVNGNLLPAKSCVVGIIDIAAHQAPLGMAIPVGDIGSKMMLLRDFPSTIDTYLVVVGTAAVVG